MKHVFLLPWRIVKALFGWVLTMITNLMFSLLVFGGFLYLLNSPQFAKTPLTQVVNTGLEVLGQFVFQENNQQPIPDLPTDQVQTVVGVRWKTNQARIYIASSDSVYRKAYEEAVENWNATGVFQLIIVDDRSQADIVAEDYSDSTSPAAGLAETTINPLTQHFKAATVKLNRHYLSDPTYGYDSQRIRHTAEHEIGHALGLGHEDEETSVMASSGSFVGIQTRDVEALRLLYK